MHHSMTSVGCDQSETDVFGCDQRETEVFGGDHEFETGATRDMSDDKIDYEGFMSPLVVEAFGEYMHRARNTSTGLRSSDNWQKGIPIKVYMKSMLRHMMSVWLAYRSKYQTVVMDDLLGLKFNVDGMILEELKLRQSKDFDDLPYSEGWLRSLSNQEVGELIDRWQELNPGNDVIA